MRVLVTGADGFIGRHVCRDLVRRGCSVYRVDIQRGSDMLNYIRNMHADAFFDLVVHAAAADPNRVGIDTKRRNFPYNAMLDASLFEWVMRTRQKRVVYFSSSAVYSDEWVTRFGKRRFMENHAFAFEPFDVYGQTKRFGEKLAMQAQLDGIKVHILRPFSGYGSDQSEDFPFGAFIGRAYRREDPFTIWGNPHQARDWVHVDDIIGAMFALIEHEVTEPVNICTGRVTTMLELAELCMKTRGYHAEIRVDKDAPMGVVHRAGDPSRLYRYYVPKISIEEGVHAALRKA